MKPLGSGVPLWLDPERYLVAEEIRALPPTRYGGYGTCAICGNPPGPPTFQLEGAHIWRGGMSGKKDAGPTVEACYDCHQGPNGIDRRGHRALAIRRADHRPVYLEWDGTNITERELWSA